MKNSSLEQESKMGVVIRRLNAAFKHRFTDNALAVGLDEVSIMNGWILGYLDYNSNRDIYQKTLETELCIGKSSITALVKLLEKNEFITRVAVPDDARLKKIVLTPKGLDAARKGKNTLDSLEDTILKDIDPDELKVFLKVSEQMRKNLEEA